MDTAQEAHDLPENAICGQNGRPIIRTLLDGRAGFVCELAEEYLGYKLEATYTSKTEPTNDACFVPAGDKPQRKLSIPEIAVIEAFNWLSQTYLRAIRQNTPITFPKIVHDIDDECLDDKERLGFTDEARAYMFASVLENTFRLKAKVVEGPHGWVVAVADHESNMTMLEMSELHKMQGACMVLYDYTVSPAQNACADDSKSGEKVPSPESRVAWHDRKNAR